jgi:hypothetical protein
MKMAEQTCVFVCAQQQNSNFTVSVFRAGRLGSAQVRTDIGESDFKNILSFVQISPDRQQQLLASLKPGGDGFVVSYVQVPDSFAQGFGIELHDGDLPDESNTMEFKRISGQDQNLIVHIILNGVNRGFAKWAELKGCLEAIKPLPTQVGTFTTAQLDQINTALNTGSGEIALAPSNGTEGAILDCISANQVSLPPGSFQP